VRAGLRRGRVVSVNDPFAIPDKRAYLERELARRGVPVLAVHAPGLHEWWSLTVHQGGSGEAVCGVLSSLPGVSDVRVSPVSRSIIRFAYSPPRPSASN
jgi:hypothetical protein